MKVRIGLVLATAAIISGAGCAAGGGGPAPSSPAAAPVGPGGEVLPPGVTPRDNEHTRSADLYLAQATAATDEAEIQQKYQSALQAANDGIQADPENPKSYFQAAQANVGLGNFAEAAEMFDRAEEIYPRYVLETELPREQGWVTAYNAAIDPLNQGNLEEAAVIFEAANDLYDERPEAFLQLGNIYSRLMEPEKSAEAFQAAMELLEESRETQLADTANAATWEQHWEIATSGLGQAFMYSEQYQQAADLYGDLLEDDPGNALYVTNLAGALSELGQADSVQALYDQLLNRPGVTERDYFNAAIGFYQIENWEMAAEAFAAAAEMNPFNRDARLNLAQTYMVSENYEAAVEAARELLQVDPRSQEGWLWLTRALSETGQPEEANRVINEFQDIGYHVTNMRLQGPPDGGASLNGEVINDSREPGETVVLRFVFGNAEGEEVGSETVRVQMPAAGEAANFSAQFNSTEVVTGYRYEVVEG